ncbi:MAG: complement resistance protein TraT [Alcanivoracaceae bacterium]|nr:complement resistance protein TraT [Alcanivoracaceae bacterium]
MGITKLLRLLIVFVVSTAMIAIIGCSAVHTAVNKRHLDIQTKMSHTVFLDPVAASKRTIFIQIRNTTDKPELNVAGQVMADLQQKGYTVLNDPDKAHYVLQANVLQVAKMDLRAAQHALDGGYGAAISGGVVGALAGGAASGNSNKGAAVVGLLGAALSTIGDAMIKDISYTVITDLQISEAVGSSVTVKEKTKSKLVQGTSGSKIVTSTERVKWKRYQTRIISTANKTNLKFKDAVPGLVSGLARSISGLF